MYRLVLACNVATHQGEMQLAWAPSPKTGMISAAADGKTPFTYEIKGAENMSNGNQGTAESAAINLYETKHDSQTPRMPLPEQTLTIRALSPDQTVEFPFSAMTPSVRQALAACLTGSTQVSALAKSHP